MNCDWEKGEMFTMRTVSDTHAVTTQDAGGLSTAIRTHHRAFAETLDGYTADLEAGVSSHDPTSLAELLDGLTGFLTGELLPRARRGTDALPRAGSHHSPACLATATMRADHEYIGEYVCQIGETSRQLRAAGGGAAGEANANVNANANASANNADGGRSE